MKEKTEPLPLPLKFFVGLLGATAFVFLSMDENLISIWKSILLNNEITLVFIMLILTGIEILRTLKK